MSVPAVVAVAHWRNVVAVASGVRQIRPELLGVLDLLSDLLHKLVEIRFAVVVDLVVRVPLTAFVAGPATIIVVVLVGWELLVPRKLERLNLNLLIISSVLLINWISRPLRSLPAFVTLDKKICIRVVKWIRASLSPQLGLTATHKNSFTDVMSRLLQRRKECIVKLIAQDGRL